MKNIILIVIILYCIIININVMTILHNDSKIHNHIKFNKGQLIVTTHDYEHIDIFVMLNEIIKQKQNVSIVFADHIWNHLLYYYIQFIGIDYITFIFRQGGTVKQMINKIQNDETVIIYSYRDNIGTGIYYTLKETKCPLVLCQIQSNFKYTNLHNSCLIDVIMKNLNKTYHLYYKRYKYNLYINDKNFIKKINQLLYTI